MPCFFGREAKSTLIPGGTSRVKRLCSETVRTSGTGQQPKSGCLTVMSARVRTADIVRRDRQERRCLCRCAFQFRTARRGVIARVICPTGNLSILVSSPILKNILLRRRPKSVLEASPSRPERGAYHDRHGRWVRDAVDAAASGARIWLQGRLRPVSGQRRVDERRCCGR